MLSYKTIISFIEKKEEQDNVNIKRNSNEFQFQAVIPIKRNIVWYNSLSCKLMQNKSLAFYDLYSIGGPYNLRGYSDDFFMGNNLAYLNSELRLLTSKDSRFFLFFDYGLIQDQREGINLVIDDAISYGIGLRYPTRLGIVMMDYALHYYEQKFLHPMDAYIHLGIQTNF
jgi:outer membrane protein assembly factor BamA